MTQFHYRYSARTHVGLRRKVNEDALAVRIPCGPVDALGANASFGPGFRTLSTHGAADARLSASASIEIREWA